MYLVLQVLALDPGATFLRLLLIGRQELSCHRSCLLWRMFLSFITADSDTRNCKPKRFTVVPHRLKGLKLKSGHQRRPRQILTNWTRPMPSFSGVRRTWETSRPK